MPSPNVVQFSSTTPTISCLNNNNFYLGVQNQEYGETSETGFWNGITPPSGGYITYYNKLSGGPAINYIPNDADLVFFMYKRFPNDFGSIYQLPEAVRIPVIFSIANTYNDFIILEKDYENIITDGLVLCLDAGFRNSYGGLGTSWRDLSIENNNGTLTNGPTYSTDGEGSIVFDGTDDYVNIGQIDNTSNISFFGWVKNNGSFVQWNSIISKDGGPTGNRIYQISIHDGKLELHLLNGGSGDAIFSPDQVPNGEWFSFGATSELGVGSKLYLNGEIVATSTATIPTNASSRVTQLHTYYNGVVSGGLSIALCLMYNKTLTPSEILQNYNETKGRFGITDNTEPPTGGAPPPAVSPTPTPTITPTITLTPSSTPAPEIVTDGLVFSVDAADTNSYSGGTTWYDLVGDNDGTLTNGPTFDEANGGSIVFDGANDYVQTSTSPTFNISNGNFTVSLFFYLSINANTSNLYYNLLSYEDSPTNSPFYIRVWRSGINPGSLYTRISNIALISTGDEGAGYKNGETIYNASGKWTNIVFVENNGTSSYYINGNHFVSDNTPTLPSSDNLLNLGTTSTLGSIGFDGSISNIHIYNRALTPEEISQNYNVLKVRFGFSEDVVTDGLVFAVDAGNTYSYDGSGTTWYDLIGGNHGTLTNGPTFDSDNGGSIIFDGVNDYVSISPSFPEADNAPYTYSVMVFIDQSTGTNQYIVGNGAHSASEGGSILLYDISGEKLIRFSSQYDNYYGQAEIQVNYGEWLYVVGTNDGLNTTNSVKLYINGELKSQNTPISKPNDPQIPNLTLGTADNVNGGLGLNGKISFVQIYNRTLTTEEIAQNYNALKDRFGLPNLTPTSTPAPEIVTDSLVLYYDADNSDSYTSTGTTWYDLSGNNSDGVIYNNPSLGVLSGITYLVFDGTDDYVDFSISNINTTITVEMWAKINSFNGGMFFGWNSYDVWTTQGHLGFNTFNSDIYGIPNSVVNNELNLTTKWVHYVFVMNSNVSYVNNKIYINSNIQGISQVNSSQIISNTSFNNGNGRISGVRRTSSYMQDMLLSKFRIYNRELTESEIKQNFDSDKKYFNSEEIFDTSYNLSLAAGEIVTDGLVFYIDGGNNDTYPGSGTTIYDLSGNDNNGNMSNVVYENYYFNFTGNTKITLDGNIMNPTAYTKFVTFYTIESSNNIVSGDNVSQHAFWLGGTPSTLQSGHNGTWSRVSSFVSFRRWVIGAVTFSSTNGFKLYVNGTLVDTDTNTDVFNLGGNLYIGSYSGGNYYIGNIQVVQIYNRELSSSEITTNYNAFKNRYNYY